jgi:ATP-dependent exoDNAse (exonuclease V) beta subunit
MIKWNKKYTYPKTVRSNVDGKRVYEVGDEKLPSVTTILGQTQSIEKQESLAKWIAKKGRNEADRIKATAAARGSAMHSIIERHLLEKDVLDLTDVGQEAHRMAKVVMDKGFGELEEIWGSEVTLSYPGLYAGQTDLCGVYQGRDSIIDFKQSNKPKREEWIEDYYYQLVAYAMAHDAIYGTQIEQGVILMCTPDLFFQKFVLNGARFRQYKWKWLWRLSEYYKKKM